MKGTVGLEDRRGKDLVPGPFHPDFHSVSPCPNEFFSFFFFFPSPLPVLSTSETFLKRKFLKMKDPFFLLLLFPRDFLETRCPLFLSGKNSS